MTSAVQHRRGTTAEHSTFTGLEGEVTIDTTKDTAVIHDGTLAGGYPLAKENLANVSTSGLSSIDGASTASDDKFFIYDQSATTLKTITRAELNNAIEQDALANVAITGGTINGTAIGGSTAAAVSATTLTTSSTVTLNGGTANGVAYLNGSKVLTTGSALTFDGTGVELGYGVANTSITVYNGDAVNRQRIQLTMDGVNGVINVQRASGTIPSLIFKQDGSEQMRLTSTGLGVGATPNAVFRLDVNGNTRISSAGAQGLEVQPGATTFLLAYNRNTSAYTPLDVAGEYVRFSTNNGAERARIDSSGNLLVGTTANGLNSKVYVDGGAGEGLGIRINSENAVRPLLLWNAASTGNRMVVFYTGSGATNAGYIESSGSTTVYGTSSDYRLKNIIGPITNSGAYIDSLNPVEGTWKADGSTFVGLIAHEVQEASRTKIATGVKDGEEMQGMTYSSSEMIANMIAELKSLRARVAQLESN